jgi:hypothetical protein
MDSIASRCLADSIVISVIILTILPAYLGRICPVILYVRGKPLTSHD